MEVLYNRLALVVPILAVLAAIVVLMLRHADGAGQVTAALVALAGVLANGLLNALSQSAHLATLHPPSSWNDPAWKDPRAGQPPRR